MQYLRDVNKDIGHEAKFNLSSTKFRYEIELPESVRLDSDEYVCTSKVKGKKRYQTETLRDIIEELEKTEGVLKDALVPFLRSMFARFHTYRLLFQNVVSCLAELDCLCALAIVSRRPNMSCPEILSEK